MRPGEDAAEGFDLLKDLFDHEMIIAAFFCRLGVPLDLVDHEVLLCTSKVGNVDMVGVNLSDLAAVEINAATGVGEHGWYVGSDDGLSIAETDDERAVLAGSDDAVRFIDCHNNEGVGAGDDRERTLHSGEKIAVVEKLDEMSDNFGVGLRFEGVILEIGFLEALIIFNDAIVHNGDLALWPEMRMGVFVRWLAVGGPTGVADADVPARG